MSARCDACALSLMFDPQYASVNLIKMLGSIRGGMSATAMSDAMDKCVPEAQRSCVQHKSGSMTVVDFAECVAGKLQIDVGLVLEVMKAILSSKL